MAPLDQIAAVSDDQSELTMSVLMTPDMANFSGNVHQLKLYNISVLNLFLQIKIMNLRSEHFLSAHL